MFLTRSSQVLPYKYPSNPIIQGQSILICTSRYQGEDISVMTGIRWLQSKRSAQATSAGADKFVNSLMPKEQDMVKYHKGTQKYKNHYQLQFSTFVICCRDRINPPNSRFLLLLFHKFGSLNFFFFVVLNFHTKDYSCTFRMRPVPV